MKTTAKYWRTEMKPTLTILTALLLAPLAALHAADAPPASLARDSGPAANLLQNPSFEKKAGEGVEGWMSRAWAGKEATRWSVETPGRTGERCVSIASDHGGDAAWTAMVSVQPAPGTGSRDGSRPGRSAGPPAPC